MDADRARGLLARERRRIEDARAGLDREGPLEASDRSEPGDKDSENLYMDELNAGRAEDLRRDLAAVERAEARLAAGSYGLSIESGEPIPDGRLEAVPTAERTLEEQRRYDGLSASSPPAQSPVGTGDWSQLSSDLRACWRGSARPGGRAALGRQGTPS